MIRLVGGAVVLLSVAAVTSAAGQIPTSEVAASGTLRPAGPPEGLARARIGETCVVDLTQEYVLDGTLAGGMEIDYRIFVAGPCGSPPGTYDEQWIAHGRYRLAVEGAEFEGPLVYLGQVEAGGSVEGTIRVADALEATLAVSGKFEDGTLVYRGIMTRPTR